MVMTVSNRGIDSQFPNSVCSYSEVEEDREQKPG